MQLQSKSLLIKAAAIRAMAPGQPEADAIMLRDGVVQWVGKIGDAPSAEQVLEIDQGFVYPGLIDAHTHPLWVAADRAQLQLGESTSIQEVLDIVRTAASSAEPGRWIVACNLNEFTLAERRLPTAAELDEASGGRNPVLIRRFCGHTAIANTAAQRLAGVIPGAPEPFGGVIERQDGVETGVFRERAAERFFRLIPLPHKEEVTRNLAEIAQEYLALGVTTIVEAAVGFAYGFEREWEVWQSSEVRNLPIRIHQMLRLEAATARRYHIEPDVSGPGTLKFFADGIIGGRTAAFHAAYCNCLSRGLLMMPPELLNAEIRKANEEGWQIAIHAIGDRGIDQAVEALRYAHDAAGEFVRPPRIEHFGFPTQAAISELAALGAVVVTQPTFISRLGDAFLTVLGDGERERMYPGRSLLNAGLTMAGSSDWPAGLLSPFEGMAAAMERKTVSGQHINASEALNAYEAVQLYTVAAARATGVQGSTGQLVPGSAADLIVVDRDLIGSNASEIRGAKVLMTVVSGVAVYARAADD